LESFLNDLHDFLMNPKFLLPQHTKTKTEAEICAEIRHIIINFLKDYFREAGYTDFVGKANYTRGRNG